MPKTLNNSERLWAFVEGPILWGAIGMIVGSIGSLLSIKWFFFAAWILIGIAIVRAGFWAAESTITQFFGNGFVCVMFALVLFGLWRALPKPKEQPSVDEIADAIVGKLGGIPIAQYQGQPASPGTRPNPPRDLTVAVTGSPADVIADKVVKKLSGR
jgi:hypothetical protein